MNLPIRAFFSFYKEGIKLQACEYREILRLNSVSGIISLDYYNHMNDFYSGFIDEKLKELPEKPQGPAFDLNSKEAKNILMDIFANVKRSMGYSAKRITPHGSG